MFGSQFEDLGGRSFLNGLELGKEGFEDLTKAMTTQEKASERIRDIQT